MKTKKVGEIVWQGQKLPMYETKENIFKPLKGNRDVRESHVKALISSMQKELLFTIVQVNEKMEVIDGQHRIAAMLNLGLPINYVTIDKYGLNEVRVHNSNNKTFSNEDILHQYCELGNENYLAFRDFQKTYGFGILASECLLTDSYSANISQAFKYGNFIIRDYERAVKYAEMIRDFDFMSGNTSYTFVSSIVPFFKNINYNHNRMKRILFENGNLLITRKDHKYILFTMQQWYNYGLKKNRIFILSEEERELLLNKIAA